MATSALRPAVADRTARHWSLIELAVGVVAFLARVVPVVVSGGFGGNYGYDPGVYYTAGAAFADGRLPYRDDFVLLHPPGIMIVLAPFAVLGRLTTDSVGFTTASLAFTLVGAVNAVLVVVIARRLGTSGAAAAAGGLFYALWAPSVIAEFLPRLEPLGNFFLLLGLVALVPTLAPAGDEGRCNVPGRGAGIRRSEVTVGVALAAGASVKIWGALPFVVVLVYLVATQRRRAARAIAISAVVTAVVINGPFFALAPSRMLHMVVLDQFGRPRVGGIVARMAAMAGVGVVAPGAGDALWIAVTTVVLAPAVALCVLGWQTPAARVFVLVFVTAFVLLVVTPSFFPAYGDFLVAPMAVVVAVTAPRVGAMAGRRTGRSLDARTRPALALAVVVVGAFTLFGLREVAAFPGRQLQRALGPQRCVTSDLPMDLIRLNALSTDLRHGCRVWVDVSGLTYDRDQGANAGSVKATRQQSVAWQRDLTDYLLSGDAFVLGRTGTLRHLGDTGESAATLRALRAHRVLARVGSVRVYATS